MRTVHDPASASSRDAAAAVAASVAAVDAEARPAGRRPRSFVGRASRAIYGVYSLSLLALLLLVAAVLAFVLPTLSWRRACARWVARAWLWLVGLRLQVDGLERLPAGSCVLVANHSSYLDGVLMKAGLPPRFSFVIKREANAMPVMGFLLRRLGSEFVDRHTAGGRQRDARRVMKRAEQGHSLVFFPEGTFDSVVGLKRFHVGAFVAAARTGMPLVPSIIHGARRSLPNRTHVPLPGPIRIEILPAIVSEGRHPHELRDQARELILERLGEPDLASRTTAPDPAS